MKHVLRIYAFVVLLFLPSAARAAIAHTAHGGATGGTHNATSIAVTVTAAVGETIIACCAGAGCTSVTDNASPANTYTAGPTQGTNLNTSIFYSRNIANAPTTVTFTVSGTENAAAVETYTGVQAVGNTGTNSGSSTSATVTATTQDSNNWVSMCAGNTTASITWSASAPNNFYHSASSATTGGVKEVATGDGGAVAAAGSDTVTMSLSTSEPWGAVGLELRSSLPTCGGSTAIALLGVGCR